MENMRKFHQFVSFCLLVHHTSNQLIHTSNQYLLSLWYSSRSWQDKSINSCSRKCLDDCKRCVVLYTGSKIGFVEGAECAFPFKTKGEDYHGTINSQMFNKWMKEELLPRLEEPSVIVMDNSSVHSVLLEKTPSQMDKVAHNVPFEQTQAYQRLRAKASQVKIEKK